VADFLMPSLGADMERGILSEWLVKPGQTVNKGDLIAVVETDKGAIEVEVWDSGVVDRLWVEAGAEVPVGTPLAHIREEGAPVEHAPAAAPVQIPEAAGVAAPVQAAAPPPQARSAPSSSTGGGVSPWARSLAAERGVDLSGLTGTGPGGAIVGRDVPERPVPKDPLQGMRRAVARAMEKSKREIPHYYLSTEVDLTDTLAWLAQFNADLPARQRVLPIVLWLKAIALAVHEVPEVNGFWREGALTLSEAVHLGVAVSLRGGGLVAPALHDVDDTPLPELVAGLADVVTRARRGRLRGSEMMDATLTVTSMGDRGVERVDGVIYPPQVGIVGVGRATERAWVVDGAVAVRTVTTLTFAGDHRAHDGHKGGLFLSAIAKHITHPEDL